MLIENPVFGSKTKKGSISLATDFRIYVFVIFVINSQISLMSSVYNSFHHTVKYGRQRHRIYLQDLTGLEF